MKIVLRPPDRRAAHYKLAVLQGASKKGKVKYERAEKTYVVYEYD